MDTNIAVKQATKEHISIIASFNKAMALETEGLELVQDKVLNGVKKIFTNRNNGFYLVAVLGNNVVGCLLITPEWSDWRNGMFWWLQSVYVLPEYRGQGIFTKMYQFAKGMAKDFKIGICGFRLYADRNNHIAHKTYSKLGMTRTNYLIFEELNLSQSYFKKTDISCTPINYKDRSWIRKILQVNWGSDLIITKGVKHPVAEYPGFIAWKDNRRVGLLTYHLQDRECEITSLNSLAENQGIATALLNETKIIAIKNACKRIWLITTNDNCKAMIFYQKRKFKLKALYPGAISETRKTKPSLPLLGIDRIPIRDEIELELLL